MSKEKPNIVTLCNFHDAFPPVGDADSESRKLAFIPWQSAVGYIGMVLDDSLDPIVAKLLQKLDQIIKTKEVRDAIIARFVRADDTRLTILNHQSTYPWYSFLTGKALLLPICVLKYHSVTIRIFEGLA